MPWASDVEPVWPKPGDTVHFQHDHGCEEATVLAVADGAVGELDLRLADGIYHEVKYAASRVSCWHGGEHTRAVTESRMTPLEAAERLARTIRALREESERVFEGQSAGPGLRMLLREFDDKWQAALKGEEVA